MLCGVTPEFVSQPHLQMHTGREGAIDGGPVSGRRLWHHRRVAVDLTTIVLALVLLAAVAPYVAWVKHPRQRPFAAYLVFVSVFAVCAVVLFVLLAWLVQVLGLGPALGPWGLAALLLLLGVVPALAVATWQARQPPSRRGPPD